MFFQFEWQVKKRVQRCGVVALILSRLVSYSVRGGISNI